MDGPFVAMRDIVKSYGKVRAIDGVSLTVDSGEIVGLVGDNGAGKSTLIKVLSGAIAPTSGTIDIKGRRVRLRDTRDAIECGIETIYQDSALVDLLSIGRNLFMGREPTRRFGPVRIIDQGYVRRASQALLAQTGIAKAISVDTPVSSLSGGERQAVAIARAMFFEADLIILDEPTNNLGVDETHRVLDFVREAKAAGHASVFITHNIHHIFEVADRIVVLRRGRKAADLPRTATSIEEIERIITGLDRPPLEAS